MLTQHLVSSLTLRRAGWAAARSAALRTTAAPRLVAITASRRSLTTTVHDDDEAQPSTSSSAMDVEHPDKFPRRPSRDELAQLDLPSSSSIPRNAIVEEGALDERPRKKPKNRQIHPDQVEPDYTRLEPPWEDMKMYLEEADLTNLPPRPDYAAPIKRMPRVAVCENTPLMLAKLEDMRFCNLVSINDTFGPPPDHPDWLPKKRRRKIHCTKHFRQPTDAIWYMVKTNMRETSKKATARNMARTKLVAALEVASRTLSYIERKFYRGRLVIFKANGSAQQAPMTELISDMKSALTRLALRPLRSPPVHSKRDSVKKTSKPHDRLPPKASMRGLNKAQETRREVGRTRDEGGERGAEMRWREMGEGESGRWDSGEARRSEARESRWDD